MAKSVKQDLILFLRKFISLNTILPPSADNRKYSAFITAAWLYIVYTVGSGAVRKWVFGKGAAGNVVFLIQLLMPLVFYFLLHRRKVPYRFSTPQLFQVLVFYFAITAINPMNMTLFHGVIGFIIHLGFWICLLGWFRTRPFFEIEKMTNLLIAVLLVEVLLGSAQSLLPASHFLNILPTGGESDAFVGKAVRVSGTFSYLAGLASFVVFLGFFVWFLLVMEYPPVIILIVFALSLFTGFVAGGRGAVGIFLIISFWAFIITGFFFQRFLALVFSALLLAGGIYFSGSKIVKDFSRAYENFLSRYEEGQKAGDVKSRVSYELDEVIDFRGSYPVFGVGLGSTYQGANAVFGTSQYVREYGYNEGEAGRIVLEGGYILFFLRIAMFFVFMSKSVVPFSAKVIFFALFFTSQVVFSVYFGAFFFLGIIFLDRAYYLKLLRNEEMKRARVQAARAQVT